MIRQRIAVTGGAGFVGEAMLRSAHSVDKDVVILDTASRLARSSTFLSSVETCRVDDWYSGAELARKIDGCTTVVHLYCPSNPASSFEDVALDLKSNLSISVHLFEACIKSGVKRIVYASSGGTVYGPNDGSPITETATCRPISPYGVSKYAAENYLSCMAARHGIQAISLRIGNPFGRYQLENAVPVGVFAQFLKATKAGVSIKVWGDGSVVRDFIHVDDLAEAVWRFSMLKSVANGPYNVSSGVGLSVGSLLKIIEEHVGRPLPVNYLDARGYDVPRIVLDTGKARAQIEWECKRPVLEALRLMTADFLDNT